MGMGEMIVKRLFWLLGEMDCEKTCVLKASFYDPPLNVVSSR